MRGKPGPDEHRRPRGGNRLLVVATAATLVGAAVGLSIAISSALRSGALAGEQQDLASFAQTALVPAFRDGARITVQPQEARRLRQLLAFDDDIRGLEIWRRDFRQLWATAGFRRGATPDPGNNQVLRAIGSGTTARSGIDPEGRFSVATPIRGSGEVVGVVVVHADATAVLAPVSRTFTKVAGAIGLVFALVLGLVALVAHSFGRRLREQGTDLNESSHELVESYRELERSAIETIETLNAAVEAKDPYTAGHSQRVRRISLALGRELQLSPKRLGALATAALFHDVGKIGVPDDILTKEGRLTEVEFQILKRHPARGAEIVGKLSRHESAVPGIRHHHERWDGRGYPDGLAGEDIPLEASIIGLADAWDAMITERPYRNALPVHVAIQELGRGRGEQFNPAVVDAFLAVWNRNSADVLGAGGTRPALVAVG